MCKTNNQRMVEFNQSENLKIKAKDLDSGRAIESQTFEANLLFAILQELKAMNHAIERNRQLS